MRLTNEQFLPIRWVVGNTKPGRKALAEHIVKLRRIDISLGNRFRLEAMRIGIWPVSWRKADGSRYLSQNY